MSVNGSSTTNGGHTPPWPTLPQEARQGLAGRIVQTIEPYTEADPVALLIHVLVGFGNIVGTGPHFKVEYTRHPARLFAVLVGESSKARKGQSWSTPKHLLTQVSVGRGPIGVEK
jgi:hypothetical protein